MTPRKSRSAITSSLIAAALFAGACDNSFLPGSSDPAQLYVLTPKSTYPDDLPNAEWQLTIDLPIAQAGLNIARIALRRTPTSLEYYARSNWIDTAPLMIQTLLVESFENSGKIVSVGRQSIALRPDYVLITDLREFQAEYFDDGPPEVRVRMNAKLIKMPERVSIASNSGTLLANSSYSSSLQKPITLSTPPRLYQLRSKTTISPAAGRWWT